MADRGPGPQDLIRKRVTVEIKRLESMIESQELQIMETYDQIQRLEDNINASKKEIEKQQENLAALDSSGPGNETN